MFQVVGSMLVNLLKGYLVKLATKEFAHYVFFEIADAIVKNTKTEEDDKWLKVIKSTVEGKEIPKG